MVPSEARVFWKALMDNASRLVADARLLLDAGSAGRARALIVLAQEELGKALWIYETFFHSWGDGDERARTVDRLAMDGRSHSKKYLEAFVYGNQLAEFWGDYRIVDQLEEGGLWEDGAERCRSHAEAAAKSANLQKQRGFYVDRDETGGVHSPQNMSDATIAGDLQRAAQVVEMLLIQDHSRMKFDATTPYDSTHEQQFRLLPVSHPEDFRRAFGGEPQDTE